METSDSLQLIVRMIEGAKSAYRRVSYYFLIWGTVMFLCGLGEYLLVYQLDIMAGFMIWPALGLVGGILSYSYSRKQDKLAQVESYYDLVFMYLWGGFVLTLILIITFSVIQGINPTPYVMLITALPTFLTGGLVKSKSLKIGGIVFWLFGSIAFLLPNEYTGPFFSCAILLGYLIPGLNLRKTENQLNQST